MPFLKSIAVFALLIAAFIAQAKDPVLRSLTVSPVSVVGGNSTTGTLRLSSAAPGDGLSISLVSDSSNASVPAVVAVSGGSAEAKFVVSTSVVSTNTPVVISASLGSVTKSSTLKVELASVTSLAFTPSSLIGGGVTTGTVTLNGSAASGGAVVLLSSGNSFVSVPETVTVPGGANSATFTTTTRAVSADTAALIVARSGGGVKTALLVIQAPILQNVTVSPLVIIGGNSVSGTVNLHHPAPDGGITVALSASSTLASMPHTIQIPAGSRTNGFTVTTYGVVSPLSLTVSASVSGTIRSTDLRIIPAQITGLVISPNTVSGGSSATATIYLSGAAPSGGGEVFLFSNNRVATVPNFVTITGGMSQVSFQVDTKTVSNLITAIISARYRGNVQTAGITVQPPSP
jgi:hypothetical protein